MTLGAAAALLAAGDASGRRPAASPSPSTTGRCAPRPARRSSSRPRRWPRRSPPNGTRSTAEIDPERLPFTRAANSAIDRVAPPARRRSSTRSPSTAPPTCSATAPPSPTALAARQAAGWDPWLVWAARALGAPLRRGRPASCTSRSRPPSLAALRAAVAGRGRLRPDRAARSRHALGLARARPRRRAAARSTPPTAWELSRIDETWQAEQWGLDAEAEAAAARAPRRLPARRRDCSRCSAAAAHAMPLHRANWRRKRQLAVADVATEPLRRRLTFPLLPTKVAQGGRASALGNNTRGATPRPASACEAAQQEEDQ